MSARFLMALFDSIYVIALAAWIGSALFLSLGLIPLIVKQLGPEPAEKLVRALLPRYCVWGAICGRSPFRLWWPCRSVIPSIAESRWEYRLLRSSPAS